MRTGGRLHTPARFEARALSLTSSMMVMAVIEQGCGDGIASLTLVASVHVMAFASFSAACPRPEATNVSNPMLNDGEHIETYFGENESGETL